jgi:hypothetical protein
MKFLRALSIEVAWILSERWLMRKPRQKRNYVVFYRQSGAKRDAYKNYKQTCVKICVLHILIFVRTVLAWPNLFEQLRNFKYFL